MSKLLTYRENRELGDEYIDTIRQVKDLNHENIPDVAVLQINRDIGTVKRKILRTSGDFYIDRQISLERGNEDALNRTEFARFAEIDFDFEDGRQFDELLRKVWSDLNDQNVDRDLGEDPRIGMMKTLVESPEILRALKKLDFLADDLSIVSEKLIQKIARKTGDRESRLETVYRLAHLLSRDLFGKRMGVLAIPEDLLFKMTLVYREELKRKRVVLERILPDVKASITAIIRDRIVYSKLPLPPSRLDQIMAQTRIMISDSLVTQLKGCEGSFGIRENEIFLDASLIDLEDSDQVNFLRIRETLTHEFLHALSGLSIVMEVDLGKEYDEEDETRPKFFYNKLGLIFGEQFRWLNEAVTEDLTIRLLENIPEDRYVYERRLLYLLKKSVPEELFDRAYFEDNLPDKNGKFTSTAWEALWKAINTAFGQRFLVKLEKFIGSVGNQNGSSDRTETKPYINTDGVRCAVELFEKNGVSVEVLNNHSEQID